MNRTSVQFATIGATRWGKAEIGTSEDVCRDSSYVLAIRVISNCGVVVWVAGSQTGHYIDEATNKPVVFIGAKMYGRTTSPTRIPSAVALRLNSPQWHATRSPSILRSIARP